MLKIIADFGLGFLFCSDRGTNRVRPAKAIFIASTERPFLQTDPPMHSRTPDEITSRGFIVSEDQYSRLARNSENFINS